MGLLPPNPLELVPSDQHLTATPAHRAHRALPDALRQLDRANAEQAAAGELGWAAGTWRVGQPPCPPS